jgi:hypothetical protein
VLLLMIFIKGDFPKEVFICVVLVGQITTTNRVHG